MANQTQAQKAHTLSIINKYKLSDKDCGSSEVQVALITDRINHINAHLRANKKDYHTQRGLLGLVGARRRALNYLKASAPERYLTLINKLELRK